MPGTGGTTVIDPNFPAALRDLALACTDQLKACRAEAGVDLAYLSPAALLEPGERTGYYRLGTDELLVDAEGNATISMEDLAVALLDEAERPKYHPDQVHRRILTSGQSRRSAQHPHAQMAAPGDSFLNGAPRAH